MDYLSKRWAEYSPERIGMHEDVPTTLTIVTWKGCTEAWLQHQATMTAYSCNKKESDPHLLRSMVSDKSASVGYVLISNLLCNRSTSSLEHLTPVLVRSTFVTVDRVLGDAGVIPNLVHQPRFTSSLPGLDPQELQI